MGIATSTITEQVAAHLRQEIRRGRWQALMPGKGRLARELEVSPMTVQRALRALEEEGLLVTRGGGRRRQVVLPEEEMELRPLRVKILTYERTDERLAHHVDLKHELQRAGHSAQFTAKSQHDLGMSLERIARFVEKTEADAWVVCSGSRPILEWFAARSVPAFALFGRPSGLPIAAMAPRKNPALTAAVRRLAELGHRRIVLLAREERLVPYPGTFEQTFLDELTALGLPCGRYHLPLWENTRAGFYRCLDSLFERTPPTALLIPEAMLFHAARDHLARRGLVAPEQISMICDDPDPTFSWCQPEISHLAWDHRPIVRRVVRWTNDVTRSRVSLRQTFTRARFVEGGTIGPTPG